MMKPWMKAVCVVFLFQCSGSQAHREDSHVGASTEAILSPVKSNLTISGIFRQQTPGTSTQVATLVPDSTFFASNGTIATMGNNGYTLMDVDIDTSTGQRLYSAVFQSGVPGTQYWELVPSDFANKVASLDAQGVRLVSLHTYTSTSGQLFYSGVFQQGSAGQIFPGAMDWGTFTSTIDSNKVIGYFLTNLAVFVSGGQERYLGIWRYHPQNTNRSAIWVSEWNSLAKGVLSQGETGKRLVTMAHWELNGDRRYGGVWLDGTDTYDVVAATDASVFQRKVSEQAANGRAPARISIEHGYQPPLGLGAAFNDDLDSAAIGYDYGISEQGVTTAVGGFGYARTPWEASSPGIPMTESTRLDVASVTKAITAAAYFTLLENPSVPHGTLDTPIMNILGNGVLNGAAAGRGVSSVTVRDLLNMNSGLCDSTSHTYTGTCNNDGSCDGAFPNDYNGWLGCVLQNCTTDNSGKCGTPPFTSAYSNLDFGVLRGVVEHISNQTFESYIHTGIFVPFGIDYGVSSATDLRDVNCNPDLVSPGRPLYYAPAQTSGPGVDEQSRARDLKVCGAGGLQMTASQGNAFIASLMQRGMLTTPDLNTMLGMWFLQPLTASTGPVPLFKAPGYAKNGGYAISSNSFGSMGPTAGIVMVPGIQTQLAVFANTPVGNTATTLDPQTSAIDGLNRMYSYPLGTFSVVNRNSANFGPMCFNVSGASTAQNAGIIQWTCGTAPLAINEQFIRRDLGNGRFMLEAVNSRTANSHKCITVQFGDSNPGEIMIQYDCNGLSNQQFVFQPTSNGYGNLVVQNSGLCLTVSGGANSIYSGVAITQDHCGAGQTQEFMLHPFDVVSVVNRNSANFGPMCFNVSGASPDQNASIIQWTCGPEPLPSNMQFRRVDKGNGVFSLQAINSGRCVTVHNADSTPGEFMLQYDCNGLWNQLFTFVPTSGGYGNIVVQNSGLCLTVGGGANSIYSGVPIIQEPCSAGQSTQEFILEQQ